MRSNLFVCAAAVLAAAAGSASAETVTFSGQVHGQIVTNQFAAQGVLISANNPNRSFDLAAIFDTTQTGTADPDLEDPWSGGNLASDFLLGNVLIIAENNTGAGDGVLDNPDDEANRPAGSLIFDFASPQTFLGFDLVDLEGIIQESSSIEFFKGGLSLGSVAFSRFVTIGDLLFDGSIAFGDNSANRISPISINVLGGTDFDRAVINLGGSAAVDNITFGNNIPTPGSALLAVLGLGAAARRRRSR